MTCLLVALFNSTTASYVSQHIHPSNIIPRPYSLLPQVREEPLLGKEHKSNCFSLLAARSWNVSNSRLFTDRKFYFCLASSSELGDWVAMLQAVATGMPRFGGDDLF
jgi:hypothetical protein